jgi:hypothetical protein
MGTGKTESCASDRLREDEEWMRRLAVFEIPKAHMSLFAFYTIYTKFFAKLELLKTMWITIAHEKRHGLSRIVKYHIPRI